MATAMIEYQALDELALCGHLVLHVHDFDHVEIDGLAILGDGLHGINNDVGKRVGNARVNLGHQGSAGNVEEELLGDSFGEGDLGGLEVGKSLFLGNFDSVNNDAGMHSLAQIALSLTHELSNEENVGGGTITNDIVLSGGSATDHSSSGVLDLHLVEENVTILGDLNLTGTANEPIQIQSEIRIYVSVFRIKS